jgi:acetylornithine/LysW-gamma-L-lysine aminotransferase
MFACQHHGLEPDLMCLAKGMAGGLPMGAVLIGPQVGTLPQKSHGTTFGGNPLACAAALATIQVLESEELPQQAALLGDRLMTGLQAISAPKVRQVRGLGLMAALELRGRAAGYLSALAERRVLALTAGANVIRLLPPLVITAKEIDRVVEELAAVLQD